MKKLNPISILIAVMISVFILAAPVLANPGYLEVSPMTYDFGDVEVGSSATGVVTVMNLGMDPHVLSTIAISGSSDFFLSDSPDLPIILNPIDGGYINTIDITVMFAPSAVGYSTATLEIDGYLVSLAGMGVAQEPPPSTSVADILEFIDSSITDGTLIGNGLGKSAVHRMNALRNMIEAAGDLIEDGHNTEALQQLTDAYQRTDGLARPPDFVAGPAAPTLAGMILDLMGIL